MGLLDAAFAGLATATAHTQKNLTHARELFDTHLNAIFARIGRDWKQGRLGDHFDIKTGGTPLVSEQSFWNGGIPWYSSGELGPIMTGNPKRNISSLGLAKSNAKLLPKGTLLVGIYDTAALKMSLLDREAATNQAVAGVKPTAEMNLGYVRWAIESIKSEVLALRRGVRQKNLSLKKIKDIEIPLSSEQNQRAVLREIEAVLSRTERLVLIAERKLAALEELKQSLLHRAFRGELSGGADAVPVSTDEAWDNMGPFPFPVDAISTNDLHAGIIALAYYFHEVEGLEDTFGHVKAEKIVHFAESYLGIELERRAVRDAAGPVDIQKRGEVEDHARASGYFDFRREAGDSQYCLSKLDRFDEIKERTIAALGERYDDLETLLDRLTPLSTERAGIAATVFAAWNNLLLDGHDSPLDQAIVRAARKDWHADKLKILPGRFVDAIRWLREEEMVPVGRGRRVEAKGAKK